ncbi:MAG: L7Ae/L30e/S12e/Gadd45 family ribosomal protein, partial [Intestinibacter sp.]
VIVADDASDNTKKLFKDKSSYRKINQIYFATKVELGLAIGKAPRAVIGIKDKALSQKIIELVQSKNS